MSSVVARHQEASWSAAEASFSLDKKFEFQQIAMSRMRTLYGKRLLNVTSSALRRWCSYISIRKPNPNPHSQPSLTTLTLILTLGSSTIPRI